MIAKAPTPITSLTGCYLVRRVRVQIFITTVAVSLFVHIPLVII